MSQTHLGSQTIVQVALVVHDIQQKIRAFAEVLGMPEPEPRVTAPASETNIHYRGKPTEARAKLAFFDLGQVKLELVEPIGGPSIWREHLDKHGEGLHHIAFRVEGMEQSLAFLKGQGLEVVQSGQNKGGRYAYVDGQEKLGLVLELLERFQE